MNIAKKILAPIPVIALTIASVITAAAQSDLPKSEPKSYQIHNKKFGDLLRPRDASKRDGAHIVLYPEQPWKCLTWKLTPSGTAGYTLENHFTSKTLAPGEEELAGGKAVVQVPFVGDDAQRPLWQFKQLPDGLYQIVDARSGQALTAVSAEGGDVRVIIAPWKDRDEQKWNIVNAPDNLTM